MTQFPESFLVILDGKLRQERLLGGGVGEAPADEVPPGGSHQQLTPCGETNHTSSACHNIQLYSSFCIARMRMFTMQPICIQAHRSSSRQPPRLGS